MQPEQVSTVRCKACDASEMRPLMERRFGAVGAAAGWGVLLVGALLAADAVCALSDAFAGGKAMSMAPVPIAISLFAGATGAFAFGGVMLRSRRAVLCCLRCSAVVEQA
ncbi:MAG TPA: hypothetical protein VEI02_15750 [Planctomycetota bacterium]|nr:hypothetical protein [Planctomycetota bacterium]